MLCTTTSSLVFLYVCIAYGIGAAMITKGLMHWSPYLLISFRMFFGFFICFLIFIYLYFTNISIRSNLNEHKFPKPMELFHMISQGLTYQGIPHILLALAQQWVPSIATQIMQPSGAMIGAVLSHFCFPDERFTVTKFFSLFLSVTGIFGTAYPSFDHPSPNVTIFKMIIGYILIFIAVALGGLSSIYFKLKPFPYHQSFLSTIQLGGATIFCFLFSFYFDGINSIILQSRTANKIEWLWPILVGVFCSGLSIHAALYLVVNVGAVGVYFIEIGQVGFGIIAGVVWLKEWAHYSQFEILISIVGIAIIGVGVILGFHSPKKLEYEPIP